MTDLTLDTLVKITDADRSSMHGGSGKWQRNRWRRVDPPLDPCQHGLHVVTIRQSLHWLGPRIGVVEVAGERIDQAGKTIVERACVVEWLDTWNESTARLFACDCAERALKHDADPRSWNAITVARSHAIGEATDEDLAAELDAAWDAARAAWAAARDAAWAAGDAARDAARDAAYAAWAAARAAAGDAAYAARDAAGAAARDAEEAWQAQRLLEYLRGER